MKFNTEREYFIDACFCEDLPKWYKEYVAEKPSRIQHFFQDTLIHLYWNPSEICRHSGIKLTKENIDIVQGYWTPYTWFPVHKDFKKACYEQEAFVCQNIDMNCNDCIYLNRNETLCILSLDKKVSFIPNTCMPENMNCFKHRKHEFYKSPVKEYIHITPNNERVLITTS
jgi:hypothetical protein